VLFGNALLQNVGGGSSLQDSTSGGAVLLWVPEDCGTTVNSSKITLYVNCKYFFVVII
jgi:hypothetical protein